MNNQTITRKAFDYNALNDKATRATLRSEATNIKAAVKRTHDNIVEIGTRLIHAKEVAGHGKFMEWIEAEFEMGRTMAENFMNASKAFPNSHYSGNLGLSQTAIFALAAPSVSDETRAVALEMAADGDLKTTGDVKALIEAAKPLQPAEIAATSDYTDEEKYILNNGMTDAEIEAANAPTGADADDDFDDSDPFENPNGDDGEPNFSMPPTAPGSEKEASHPFAEVDEETANETAPEPEGEPIITSSVRAYENELSARAKTAPVVHDTLKKNAPPKDEDLSDDEWLAQIGAYRVLQGTSGRGVLARRSLLAFRAAMKAQKALAATWAKTPETKSLDANDPTARTLGKAADLPHARKWFLCTCKGHGCTRCGYSCLDPYSGVDPTRVERGEVEL